jgi:hypothetical protein
MTTAIDVARDLALLAAECALAIPADRVPDAHVSLVDDGPAAARWSEAIAKVRSIESGADLAWTELHAATGSRIAAWLATSCLACEVHPTAAAAFSLLAEDDRVHLVTAAAFARIATCALGTSYVDALHEATTGAALRLGIVEIIEPQRTRPSAQLALRLAAGELGRIVRDRRAADSMLARIEPPASRACLDERVVSGAIAILGERNVLAVRGPSARAGRMLALEIARVRGVSATILEIDGEVPPLREIARQRNGILAIDASRAVPGPALDRFAEAVARECELVVILTSRAETELPAIDLPALDTSVARAIWTEVAGTEHADSLARRFRVGLDEARAAQRDATRRARMRGAERSTTTDLADAIRARGARRMGPSVSTITTQVKLSDLVVPPHVRGQLEDIVAWYRAGDRGRAALGENGHSSLGWGLTCLFSGPPGTGKTFAAQCLATELGLNLYRIDLAQVVSKYIGETEKQLSRVFAEAEAGHGILLFDEADALFGKRMEVKEAHDRYANVEVGYLLQRLEEFEGVGILTTNLRNNMDVAFLRRLRFVLEFPIPDQPWRRELWEHAIPRRRSPDVDLAPFVERFRLSGGLIHNIGVAVAHLAAAKDGVVTPALLVRATYRELEKSGMPRSAAEFGALAVHLQGVAT